VRPIQHFSGLVRRKQPHNPDERFFARTEYHAIRMVRSSAVLKRPTRRHPATRTPALAMLRPNRILRRQNRVVSLGGTTLNARAARRGAVFRRNSGMRIMDSGWRRMGKAELAGRGPGTIRLR
jgi:hypothetical protein